MEVSAAVRHIYIYIYMSLGFKRLINFAVNIVLSIGVVIYVKQTSLDAC